jgi:hypothetical protein
MWKDEIVEETRRRRDAYVAKFNYNLEAIYRDLKKREQQSGRHVVAFPSRIPIRRIIPKTARQLSV